MLFLNIFPSSPDGRPLRGHKDRPLTFFVICQRMNKIMIRRKSDISIVVLVMYKDRFLYQMTPSIILSVDNIKGPKGPVILNLQTVILMTFSDNPDIELRKDKVAGLMFLHRPRATEGVRRPHLISPARCAQPTLLAGAASQPRERGTDAVGPGTDGRQGPCRIVENR